MVNLPDRPDADTAVLVGTIPPARSISTAWRSGLPALTGSKITLRELRRDDAVGLFEALMTEEVGRFLSPPPSTVEGFERFIEWTLRQRVEGQFVCFAIVPRGSDRAVGIFQVRSIEAGFGSAEWGFAISSRYWGTGVFADGARLVIDFVFGTLGSRRLEARSAVANGRGNGALRKLGAVREAILRRSVHRDGQYVDQALWSILAEDWRRLANPSERSVVH